MPDSDAVGASLLRSAGLRVTAPRLAVLAALTGRDAHPDADTLLRAARARLGTLSTQSAYNVLRTLVDAGLVRRIEPAGRPGLYELRVGDNHHHAICRLCDAIADVDCAVGDTPCLTAADDAGFVIDEAEVIYWGRCPTCVAAPPAPAAREGVRYPQRHSAPALGQARPAAVRHQHEPASEEKHRRG